MTIRDARSTTSPEERKSRTNKGVVLDLDECLIHNIGDCKNPNYEALRKTGRFYTVEEPDIKIEFITRPHLKLFLRFCFKYFKHVIVYSAGQHKYVHAIVKIIFADFPMPDLIYTWDNCQKIGSGRNVEFSKPLAGVLESPPLKNKLGIDSVVIIDDRKENFSTVNPKNGILIPKYEPVTTAAIANDTDTALLQLMYWFCRLDIRRAKDLRKMPKSKIFTTSVKEYRAEFDYKN